jgi:hypothetical protein
LKAGQVTAAGKANASGMMASTIQTIAIGEALLKPTWRFCTMVKMSRTIQRHD